jgi:hypothetical protein
MANELIVAPLGLTAEGSALPFAPGANRSMFGVEAGSKAMT